MRRLWDELTALAKRGLAPTPPTRARRTAAAHVPEFVLVPLEKTVRVGVPDRVLVLDLDLVACARKPCFGSGN